MPTFPTYHEERAAGLNHGALDFVSATTSPPLQEDSNNGLVHLHGERVHR